MMTILTNTGCRIPGLVRFLPAICLLMLLQSLQGQCPAGISNYWTFNNDDASHTYDTLGNCDGTSGTLPAAAPAGRAGKAVSFDGSTYINFPDYPSNTWSSDVSVAVWCKFTATPADPMVMLGYDKTGSTHWWIGSDGPGGIPGFYLYDDTRSGGGVKGSVSIADGQWHLLVGTWSSAESSQRLYVDGELVADSTRTYGSSFTADSDMGMGAMDRNAVVSFYYDGLLDEAALFDVALDEAEVAMLYTKGNEGLGYCAVYSVSPEILSTPVTGANRDEEYVYDVNATGVPAPTYSLLFKPDGMTIDPVTGLISWTPTETGVFNVLVEARNSGRNQTQSFTIKVVGPCIDEMISYFPFLEGSGDIAWDEAKYREAPLVNSPAWTTGIDGEALQFNGVNQRMTIPDDMSFDWAIDQSFTIEVWCKTDGNDGNLQVIIGRETPASTHWWVGTSSATGVAAFYLYDEGRAGGGMEGSKVITDGEWHHIVAVRDADAGINALYVDNVLEDTIHMNYYAGFGSEADIEVANFYQAGSHQFFYTGILDEIAVYNRALTHSEILEHYTKGTYGHGYCNAFTLAPQILTIPVAKGFYNVAYEYEVGAVGVPAPLFNLSEAPSGMSINPFTGKISWIPDEGGDFPVSITATNSVGSVHQQYTLHVSRACYEETVFQFSFDEDTTSVVHDVFGKKSALLMNAPSRTAGVVQNGIELNGADQYAVIEDADNLDWKINQNYTVELWCRPGEVRTEPQVMLGRDEAGATHWWIGTLGENGIPAFYLYDQNRSGGGTVGNYSIHDGEWHHIAMVRDGVRARNLLYVDGKLVADSLYTYTADFASDKDLHMGSMYINDAERYFYEGMLDEVAIYNIALTGDEIRSHYMHGRNGIPYCIARELGPFMIIEPMH